MQTTWRERRYLPHIVVFLVALSIKAAVLASLHAHPLLQPSGDMDGAVYLALARSGPPAVAYFVSPLYLYFLKLAGASVALASAAQIILGSLGVVLLFDTARRWFGLRAAFLPAMLVMFTGVVTFDEVTILQSALDPFLVALMLWALTVALKSDDHEKHQTVLRFAAAGAAAALFALNRPNALIWLAASALLLLVQRRLRQAAAFAAGCALLLAPVVLRNYAVAHELVLVSTHGGAQFLHRQQRRSRRDLSRRARDSPDDHRAVGRRRTRGRRRGRPPAQRRRGVALVLWPGVPLDRRASGGCDAPFRTQARVHDP